MAVMMISVLKRSFYQVPFAMLGRHILNTKKFLEGKLELQEKNDAKTY